jgi:hypothetical protein
MVGARAHSRAFNSHAWMRTPSLVGIIASSKGRLKQDGEVKPVGLSRVNLINHDHVHAHMCNMEAHAQSNRMDACTQGGGGSPTTQVAAVGANCCSHPTPKGRPAPHHTSTLNVLEMHTTHLGTPGTAGMYKILSCATNRCKAQHVNSNIIGLRGDRGSTCTHHNRDTGAWSCKRTHLLDVQQHQYLGGGARGEGEWGEGTGGEKRGGKGNIRSFELEVSLAQDARTLETQTSRPPTIPAPLPLHLPLSGSKTGWTGGCTTGHLA